MSVIFHPELKEFVIFIFNQFHQKSELLEYIRMKDK